ncbi:ABC transporter substrate-binding protein [Agromyces intestinalis]|nr:ABC transporter substrate-binding protein [Agromyces intestinalis]
MARYTRRVAGAAIAALLAVGLGACAPAQPGAGSQEKEGGSIVYLDAELSSNTQLQSSGTWQDSAYVQNITDRLIYRDPETGEFEPWIAEDWTISDDGLVYEFVIRDGVTYSDGTPLDVASVKRNLEWQANGDADKGIPANNWFPTIVSIDADEATRTVTVTLDQPYAPFLAVLSFWRTSLVADATIDASLEAQSQISGLIGSGPFYVKSETYGEEIVLAKREGYDWPHPGSEHTGEAYLDEIVIIPVTEDSVRLGTLKSGEADLLRYVQPSEEQPLEDAGFQVLGLQGAGNANIWDVRQQAPFLDELDVRKALQVGIDREQIVDDLYTDRWNAATSIVSPTAFGYVDLSAKLGYDPDEANRLLDEAGFTGRDADGYRTRDGETLRILTFVDVFDSTSKPLFQLIQWQLKQIGVKLDIDETDYANYSNALKDPNVGVRRNGWPEADAWVRQRVNYSFTGSNAWFFSEADPKLEELYDSQLHATTPEQRAEILAELQEYVVDQAYALPIIDDTQVFVLQPHLHGFSWSAEARPYFYDVWTEKK